MTESQSDASDHSDPKQLFSLRLIEPIIVSVELGLFTIQHQTWKQLRVSLTVGQMFDVVGPEEAESVDEQETLHCSTR